jgi:hypothetical protein
MKKIAFKTTDEFKAYHNAFLDSTLSDRLADKYKVRPFFERYAKLRAMMQNTSYLLNLFAVITSFTCVFTFVNTLIKNALASFAFAVAFLVLLELFKRLTIPNTFKAFFQFRKLNPLKVAFILCLTGTSVLLSFVGASDAVQQYTPPPTLISTDSIRTQYGSRIVSLEKRLKEIKRSQSWHGTLTPQGQKAYNAVQNQINLIEGDRIATTDRATAANDQTTTHHTTHTDSRGYYFSFFSLLLDLLLIGFFYFMEYYDYRSYTEFAELEKQDATSEPAANSSHSSPVVTTNSTVTTDGTTVATDATDSSHSVATANNGFSLNSNTVQLAIKKAKANISAFQNKIRIGEGNLDTNEKGVQRWQQEVQNLENMLPQ